MFCWPHRLETTFQLPDTWLLLEVAHFKWLASSQPEGESPARWTPVLCSLSAWMPLSHTFCVSKSRPEVLPTLQGKASSQRALQEPVLTTCYTLVHSDSSCAVYVCIL